ncbi:Uncharacterized conserved protein, DUF302 family [Monaibacterium marinum]|uniref:Uncharacterized conserved protein, DUF302 family n=1 Tax=Pontivivens marinum TaxID=1690039 RepID=A0A2C9CND0_9RHOB|nr:DUF302 domain-containing protein [Monaibacterium marinum]SOH92700.1 Uncharacterized conserved protein, DUF302 family [Monaibacterium marinum]
MRLLPTLAALALLPTVALAGPLTEREGWVVMPTDKAYETLVDDVTAAVTANGYGVVTQAGPTGAAAQRGITIPGNRVIGVFNNDIAVRTLAISTAAMIEAPIRMYVTEDEDGTATLSYKTPTFVLSPYMAEGGDDLAAIATELDEGFASIAADAVD